MSLPLSDYDVGFQPTHRALVKVWVWVAALALVACGGASQAPRSAASPAGVGASQQAINSEDKVLILGSSIAGGLDSREAQAVASYSPSTRIEVVTPEQWRAMTAEQFMTYRALIIGDASCQSGTEAFQAAIDTRKAWGLVIDGDVAIIAADPTTNGTPQLVENGIHYVLNSVWRRTGMYIALGCAYQDAPADTVVTLLEPFGTFQLQGVPGGCADSAHMFEMHSDYMSSNIFDGMLAGDGGCAARSVFTAFPERAFSYAALAMSTTDETRIPGQQSYPDYTYDPGVETPFAGTPYILVRGAMTIGSGCGIPELAPGEECDMGDYLNGQPAMPWETDAITCSFTCRTHWCGDGVVDTELGEECDNGQENGRSDDALGQIGTCTSSCKLTASAPPPPPPPPSEPPVALCQNVTVVAGDTCGASASIDQGSYDPDGDLVGCTQSPAGPYDIGQTTVTLTCTDQANHTTSCTSVVTVTDVVAPSIALNGSASQVLECSRGATYSDPGASASDLCMGPLPQSSITETGSVNLSTPATYTLTYVATDAAGNQSAPATRTVTVRDTTAPQIQMNAGPSTVQCNGTPYVEPGATASDSCSGDLSGSVTISSNLDQTHAGQYAVTYSVKDAAGNTSTATRQLTVAGPCTSCVDVHLSDYNLFVLESYSQGADVQGKVAAGGNISMQNFSVGGNLPASDINNVLVAGGNLTLSNGSIWGNAFYGNSYSANQGVTSRRGTVAQGTPIDFAARFSELRAMSSQLASVTANGTTTRESWGGIFLRGTNSSVNVFNVSASAFTGAALLSITVPSGSLAVINIRGASATFQNFGYSLSGVDARNILYNFVDTTTINASSFGFQGTLLAPYARMTFNNGSWDGGIYAVSLTGTAEGHLKPLNDRSVCP